MGDLLRDLKAALPEADVPLGPAMLALTERQRKFVTILVEGGMNNHGRAAMEAGYPGGSDQYHSMARATGWRLTHSPRVQAAIKEELSRRMNVAAVIGQRIMEEIAEDPTKSANVRLKAAEGLLKFGGMTPVKETKQTKNINVTVEDRTKKAISLMERLGFTPDQQRAALTSVGAKVTDVEFSEEPISSSEGLEDIL